MVDRKIIQGVAIIVSFNYTPVHRNFTSISKEIKALVQEHQMGRVSDEEMDAIVSVWDKSCPNLLYEDAAHTVPTATLLRNIGVRRASILAASYHRLRVKEQQTQA